MLGDAELTINTPVYVLIMLPCIISRFIYFFVNLGNRAEEIKLSQAARDNNDFNYVERLRLKIDYLRFHACRLLLC